MKFDNFSEAIYLFYLDKFLRDVLHVNYST